VAFGILYHTYNVRIVFEYKLGGRCVFSKFMNIRDPEIVQHIGDQHRNQRFAFQ